ncbi:MAG: PilZ domain-containing protein [Candidatus Omnitrophica bacterium]|nr:PilZ domain-containing protein [Candidatus Omnitrophota bacterium]
MVETERRGGARAPRAFLVRHRAPDAGGGSWLVSPLRDLSVGGARFMTESLLLKAGDPLELQLVLPTVAHPLRLPAKVVWARAGRIASIMELGVAFEFPDEASQAAVARATGVFQQRGR